MNDLLKYGFFLIAGMALMYFFKDITTTTPKNTDSKPAASKPAAKKNKKPTQIRPEMPKHNSFIEKSIKMKEFITENDPI